MAITLPVITIVVAVIDTVLRAFTGIVAAIGADVVTDGRTSAADEG